MLRFFTTKIGVSLLLAVVIIGIAVTFKHRNSEKTSAKSTTTLALDQVIKSSLDKDDDGDGLKNWEESLYKTNPKIADTDSDGTSDGEEVAQNKDPLVTGSGKTDDSQTTPTQENVIYTPTDKFSQEIFKEYIQAKQQGQDISGEISNKIAEKVLSQDYNDPTTLYSQKNVIVSPDSSVQAIKSYANALGFILSTPRTATLTETEIIPKLAEEPLENYEKDLILAKKRYENMKARLLALPVPVKLVAVHINVINSMVLFTNTVEGALLFETDPIGALGKISSHQNGINFLTQALADLQNLFSDTGISFSTTESGYILTE